MILQIDHLVLACPSLKEGVQHIEKLLGDKVTMGGHHLKEGTHNAVIKIANECYLEIIAVDENNENITGNRWMGVDLIDKIQMTRWAMSTDNIEDCITLLDPLNKDLAQQKKGLRQLKNGSFLEWKMTIPLSRPKIEVIPFFLKWNNNSHPAKNLESDCHLKQLKIYTSNRQLINLDLASVDNRLCFIDSEVEKIEAHIISPNGLIIIE